MAYDFVSEDGLARSNDAAFISNWNRVGSDQKNERNFWVRDMLAMGAKAIAPDDGWVDRERNEVSIASYADIPRAMMPGDLMALGGPGEWRLVRIDAYRQNPFIPGADGRIYSFTQIEAALKER